MRAAGILLPIFSLPGRYGIGGFGECAYKFVDFLRDSCQKYWQILPLGPTGYGDSPYQSPSVYAGNPYFIDLDLIVADGYLDTSDLKNAEKTGSVVNYGVGAVDYPGLFESCFQILDKAFKAFSENPAEDFDSFCKKNSFWLDDYALFMAIKRKNGMLSISEWGSDDKDYRLQKSRQKNYSGDMLFWKFVQYCFYKQWTALKAYANDNGILIIGDKPIYTSYDSVEVWSHPEYFQVDKSLVPEAVAGVPPDAFSADGQLWGNPLYDWDRLGKENFEWIFQNYDFLLDIYDVVRIDHFRGLAAYYSIPYGDSTARNGKWVKGPGKAFVKIMKERYGEGRIIAEDLGYLDDDVKDILAFSGYPGMKLLQFAFGEDDSVNLPTLKNSIAYVGTHDNMTAAAWIKSLKGKEKRRFKKYVCRKRGESKVRAAIRSVMSSPADTAIIMIQDYLEIADARINTPSTLGGNWDWRLNENQLDVGLIEQIKNLTIMSDRVQ